MHPAYPHGPLRQPAASLWTVDGTLGKSPLWRRMTVVRLASGETIIHSGIRLDEGDMDALERLGRVAAIVVPNTMHNADAEFYAGRFPHAKVLVPSVARDKLAGRHRVDGTLEADWPAAWNGELERIAIAGTRVGETAFIHHPTRTLILTDLCFNLGDSPTGIFRLLMRFNRALGRFGPTRLFMSMVKDRAAFSRSLAELAERDYDRIIVGHGSVIESGGKALMRRVADEAKG